MTSRDRRALWIGGTVLVALLLLRVVPWSLRWTMLMLSDLRERKTLLAHARADLATASDLRDSSRTLSRALVGLAPRLLSGATPAEAAADLSGKLNLAAVRNQMKVERLDPVADSATAGRLRRVRLHASLESDVRGVEAFLRAVETGAAVLTVEELRILAPDPAGTSRGPEILKLEVTVSGWYLASAAVGTREAEQ